MITTLFIFNSLLLGIGLAMDAFSVSLANGLNEPAMKSRRMLAISSVFGGFQFLMPLIGWFCVHTLLSYFSAIEKFIPYIALILLLYIGGKMLIEGLRNEEEKNEKKELGFTLLMLQGLATSIDALSVGFTIAEYSFLAALLSAGLIGLITTLICYVGLYLGKKIGTKFAGKAGILGGVILIAIGLEIFIKGVFF